MPTPSFLLSLLTIAINLIITAANLWLLACIMIAEARYPHISLKRLRHLCYIMAVLSGFFLMHNVLALWR